MKITFRLFAVGCEVKGQNGNNYHSTPVQKSEQINKNETKRNTEDQQRICLKIIFF